MLLNLTNAILCYDDGLQSDAPSIRIVDITRKMYSLPFTKALSEAKVVPPLSSITLFDASSTTPLNLTSILSIALLSPTSSVYRLSVTAGTSGFRTPRTSLGITTCVVNINNNSVAEFTLAGATLSSIQIGDILRVKGTTLYDLAPFAFNSSNSGLWQIIGISGTTLSCVRLTGASFEAANEAVTVATNDIQIYSAAGIQIGDKMSIEGVFSVVSQNVYTVQDATPTTIDFVSTVAIPEENDKTYVAGAIAFLTEYKKMIYIEADQNCVVRCDADTSNYNKITPFTVGDPKLVGIYEKVGNTYKCVVVNKSINTLNIKYIIGE